MSNNCCGTDYTQGGTWEGVTLIVPAIVDAVMKNTTLNGGVHFDDATAQDVVDQICDKLRACVKEHVEAVKLERLRATDVTLTDTALRGDLELSKDASDAIYEAIEAAIASKASEIVGMAISSLSPSDINAVDTRDPIITGGRIIDGTMSGTKATGITLDNASGTNIIFDTGRLKNFTLSGQVPLDTEAKTHLCQQLRDCILALLDESFSQQDVAAVFSDCDGVPRTPGTRIVSCSELTAALALMEQKIINQMPVSDVITGLFYDEEHHKIILETTLDNDKPQRWEIALDEMGGQVVTDKVTIVGTGTTNDPLRVNLLEATELLPSTEQDTWLPTSVYGGRTALLGVPDAWIDLNGWLFPVYRKSAQE